MPLDNNFRSNKNTLKIRLKFWFNKSRHTRFINAYVSLMIGYDSFGNKFPKKMFKNVECLV